MPATGSKLFEFSLQNQFGETITRADLSVGRVLIVFYPWAFSRVCGSELAELQEHVDYFREHRVRLAAISVDHKYTLRSYAESLGLEFDLLADFWPHGQVARHAGAFDESRGVATRLSLLVNDGVIQQTFTSPMTSARSLADYQHAIERLS